MANRYVHKLLSWFLKHRIFGHGTAITKRGFKGMVAPSSTPIVSKSKISRFSIGHLQISLHRIFWQIQRNNKLQEKEKETCISTDIQSQGKNSLHKVWCLTNSQKWFQTPDQISHGEKLAKEEIKWNICQYPNILQRSKKLCIILKNFNLASVLFEKHIQKRKSPTETLYLIQSTGSKYQQMRNPITLLKKALALRINSACAYT